MKLSEWLANSSTSQSEFARQLGVTQGRISQIVAGEQPSLDLAMKIAGLTNNQVRPQDFKEIIMSKTLDTVEDAIKAMANGELVVVVDDDDRENEGDLDRRRGQDFAGADGPDGAPYLRHRLHPHARRRGAAAEA